MVMKASCERLFGHDGNGEPQGRPVNWKAELASMSAPVVFQEEEVRNHTCLTFKGGLQEVSKSGNAGQAWDEVKSYDAHFIRSG